MGLGGMMTSASGSSTAVSGTLSASLSLIEGSLEDSLVSLAENIRLNREVKVGFLGGPDGRVSPLEGDFAAAEAGKEV